MGGGCTQDLKLVFKSLRREFLDQQTRGVPMSQTRKELTGRFYKLKDLQSCACTCHLQYYQIPVIHFTQFLLVCLWWKPKTNNHNNLVRNNKAHGTSGEWIGDFPVAFHLCFKASPSLSAKPFIWKLVLFTHKFLFRVAIHQDKKNSLTFHWPQNNFDWPYVMWLSE